MACAVSQDYSEFSGSLDLRNVQVFVCVCLFVCLSVSVMAVLCACRERGEIL